MLGINSTICIAGKNKCAIDALLHVKKKYKKYKLLALPNKSDNSRDGWQKSFKKFAKKQKIKITNLNELYKIRNLFLFSLEYEEILNIKKFKSNKLFNLHFSLLPKYRGCHTNFYQIYFGEKKSGVTLHKIETGIDDGKIIDTISFKITKNATAYDNYINLLNKSVTLFKKNIKNILNNNYQLKKQNLKKGTYFSRSSVDYNKLSNIKVIKNNLNDHNKIRSLIFPPFQLPIYNGKKIKKSYFVNKKIKLIFI